MSGHRWGDESFDWDALDGAIRLIDRGLRFWRVDVTQSKEKFGQARVYCSLGFHSFTQLTHPGYAFNRWPRWLDFMVYPRRHNPFYWLVRLINVFVTPLHKRIYIYYYEKAVRQWPHIASEICDVADFGELLHQSAYLRVTRTAQRVLDKMKQPCDNEEEE